MSSVSSTAGSGNGDPVPSARRRRALLLGLLLAFGALRIGTLQMLPLYDQSESRYAEIARQMQSIGDWVTPHLDPDTPFWGKPPLAFWAVASSFDLFGISEFGARAPSILFALLVLLATHEVARQRYGGDVALLATVILGSAALPYMLSAQVSIDLALAACTTVALGALFVAWTETDRTSRRRATWLAGIGLGAGLLAKGPVALALVGATVALATALAWDRRRLRSLPWIRIGLLAVLVAVPWFVLAEGRSPGFLRYFLLHENFLRYVSSQYGDLYGHGHTLPPGTIWAFAAIALLPWTPLVVALALGGLRRSAWSALREDPARAFLVAWALAPLAFFSASRNVVLTYVLPALPAIAILTADALHRILEEGEAALETPLSARTTRYALAGGTALLLVGAVGGLLHLEGRVAVPRGALIALGALLLTAATTLLVYSAPRRLFALVVVSALMLPVVDGAGRLLLSSPIDGLSSTRSLSAQMRQWSAAKQCETQFLDDAPFSAQFYLGDRASPLPETPEALRALANDHACRLVAIRRRDAEELGGEALRGLRLIHEFGRYLLYRNAAAG